MTPFQKAMINKIATSEFNAQNGGKPTCAMDTDVWADTIIETPEDKVVCTSLMNEGLVRHTGIGRYAGVCLTEDGFTAYQVLQEDLRLNAEVLIAQIRKEGAGDDDESVKNALCDGEVLSMLFFLGEYDPDDEESVAEHAEAQEIAEEAYKLL